MIKPSPRLDPEVEQKTIRGMMCRNILGRPNADPDRPSLEGSHIVRPKASPRVPDARAIR